MSGRWLLDVASLAKASKQVANKAVELQKHRLDVYSKTSTIARAAKSQTDRVVLTAKAASALAERLNSSQNEYAQQFYPRNAAGQSSSSQKTYAADSSTPPEAHPPPAHINQDRAATPSQDPSPFRPEFSQEREPLEEWPLQQAFGSQIPLQTAGPPLPSALKPEGDGSRSRSQGQDSELHFSSLSQTKPDASLLPRSKVPTSSSDVQGDSESVDARGIDKDVFYSADFSQSGPTAGSKPHTETQDEKDYSDLFHNPRIGNMLQGRQQKPSSLEELRYKKRSPPQGSFRLPEMVDRSKGPQRPQPKVVADNTQDATAENVDSPSIAPKENQTQLFQSAQSTEKTFQMRESKVPSTRIGRLWEYGGLATSMAFGAFGESLRRATGTSASSEGSVMLGGGNLERLVAKLSRMRGAALKLGQMISFQDIKMLPGPIQEVLQRVQDSADYMPSWQRDQVLSNNLGAEWRDLFSSFDEVPMAAASIGQVHGAILKSSGMPVAVKVQYPGVAASIDSDLNNLSVLLTASKLLPKGLYLDKTIANARVELAWECDYVREADAARRFAGLLTDEHKTFIVPKIISEASSSQVLTMERMAGTAVTKIKTISQEEKDWIGTQILRLCLREITEFRFMQTDPNWTNFLYNAESKKLELLDFGASRDFPTKFIDPYIRILVAAGRNDKAAIRDLSVQLGYLTGHESKSMTEAHVKSVLTLAEPFSNDAPEVYDFRDQTITDRVRGLIPVMLRERLAPPPEETYSLHRKLSGAFLLCAKLGSRVRAREMFATAMARGGFA